MKKIIFLILCNCVIITSSWCHNKPDPAESTAPTAYETFVSEEPSNTMSAPTTEELTEKESAPIESKSTETDLSSAVTNDLTTETKLSATTELAASLTEETAKPEPIVTEPVIEESAPPPDLDPAEIEQLVAKYINQYRIEQGDTIAKIPRTDGGGTV